jgi:hypothetical protein
MRLDATLCERRIMDPEIRGWIFDVDTNDIFAPDLIQTSGQLYGRPNATLSLAYLDSDDPALRG